MAFIFVSFLFTIFATNASLPRVRIAAGIRVLAGRLLNVALNLASFLTIGQTPKVSSLDKVKRLSQGYRSYEIIIIESMVIQFVIASCSFLVFSVGVCVCANHAWPERGLHFSL